MVDSDGGGVRLYYCRSSWLTANAFSIFLIVPPRSLTQVEQFNRLDNSVRQLQSRCKSLKSVGTRWTALNASLACEWPVKVSRNT